MRTTLTGVTVGVDVSPTEKVWRTFQAIGDIAFAYAYSTVLVEIQASSHFNLNISCIQNILATLEIVEVETRIWCVPN